MQSKQDEQDENGYPGVRCKCWDFIANTAEDDKNDNDYPKNERHMLYRSEFLNRQREHADMERTCLARHDLTEHTENSNEATRVTGRSGLSDRNEKMPHSQSHSKARRANQECLKNQGEDLCKVQVTFLL